jgi:hypothetical protein
LIGDDFCGTCAALDRQTGQIAEIEHEHCESRIIAASFSEFLSGLIAEIRERGRRRGESC